MVATEDFPDPNVFQRFMVAAYNMIDGPITWMRESVVEKNRPTYYWYHRKFRRVPTIDECYTDDIVCFTEANEQYKRDKMVDVEVINILRIRYEDCTMYENPDNMEKCAEVTQQWEKACENWFIKYGDLGVYHNVAKAFMKQKHRMVWERRHGKVGTGMKTE